MSRLRTFAMRLAGMLLAGALALALAEVVLRLSGLASPGGVATVNQRDFVRIPGVYSPGQHVRSRDNPALPHMVTIDSLGYRGANIAREKPAGEIRVLFTGDSFTYGSFVDDSATVPALLEAALRSSCPRVRVINAGLGGSTLPDQARLISRALPLSPDLVVVMFSENDVTDLRQTPMWDRLAANRARKSQFPASLFYATARHTALWNVLLRAKARWDASRMSPGEAEAVAPSDTPARRQEYVAALSALQDSLQSRSLSLVFAAIPTHLTVSGTQPDEQIRWALHAADSLHLPTADILSAMRAAGTGSAALYLLPHDGHTSPAGNRIAATTIANTVLGVQQFVGLCSTP